MWTLLILYIAGMDKPVITNPVYDAHLHKDTGAVYSEANLDNFIILSTSTSGPKEQIENQYAECRPRSRDVSTVPTEAAAYMELDEDPDSESGSIQKVQFYTKLRNSAVYTDLQFGRDPQSSEANRESDSETTESSTEPDETDSSSGSGISMSSADSGVVDQQHSNNTTTSDFEGDNAHYFEAKTLPLPVRKSNDSLVSTETQDSVQGIPTVVRKHTKPMIIEEDPLKKATGTDYQKLRCQTLTKDRSFSIDSACSASDNTYNSLTSKGTLTLAETDGKYSTLVREGQESKKRDNDSSDGDNNMYSELSRDTSDQW